MADSPGQEVPSTIHDRPQHRFWVVGIEGGAGLGGGMDDQICRCIGRREGSEVAVLQGDGRMGGDERHGAPDPFR